MKTKQHTGSSARHSGDARWWVDVWSVLHPATILLIAVAAAAAAFLTDVEAQFLLGEQATVLKLLAGIAILFLVGLYFSLRFATRQSTADARWILERNAADLDALGGALKRHDEVEPRRTQRRRRVRN